MDRRRRTHNDLRMAISNAVRAVAVGKTAGFRVSPGAQEWVTEPVREQRQPRPGDVVRLTAEASVQFAGDRSILLRVISVDRRATYAGWVWLTGYTVGKHGDATERREVFVRRAGLTMA
ncbi:hypothetical protein [Actinoplanes sp. NPDC049118]|uniref:hypothetical protein n=1 Tax=Actinoplanes sp. NPDC049118 TaxID=3155769 RepID=UPI0033DAD10D